MAPVTKKHQQLILLEPEQARLLDELAAELGTPKQVLLRSAVQDLLAKHAKADSPWYADIVMALRGARAVVNRFESRTEERTWLSKCITVKKQIDEILAVLGKKV